MSIYTIETVTRIEEGASLEDILEDNTYETAYIVYDEEGEIVHDTTDRSVAYSYLDNDLYEDLALEQQEQM